MFEVFEMMPVFLIYMLVIFVPILLLAGIRCICVFTLFCIYKHNGGKYDFDKFVDTRNLHF